MRLGGRGGGWTCSGQKCNNRWTDGQISLPYPTSMALPFGREEVRVGIWGGEGKEGLNNAFCFHVLYHCV